MKVLFLLADNVYLTPYLRFYTSIFDYFKDDYKIVYWDKNKNEIFDNESYIRFVHGGKSKVEKINGYLKYREFILNICKNEKFDLLVPLHSIVSFVLFDLFIKNYKKKYIYDIRDYSYESFILFRFAEKYLVKKSLINIISSEGYKEFLPKAEYFVLHNIPNNVFSNYREMENRNKKVIQISYIGLIRFMKQNEKIIRFFKNDNRFHLNFIGTNAEKLSEFCNKNNVKNVSLVGTFDPKDTLKFYDETDIIMNLYGNNTPLLDYALSNKLYYSAMLYKPILVCEDTYMEYVSSKYNFGFTLKMQSEDEKDRLEEFINNIDRRLLIKRCNSFMSEVNSEQLNTKTELLIRLRKLNMK